MKSYIYTLLMVAALTIAGNTATSLIVDPYSIVHPLIGEFAFEPNSRFSKVAFLLQNCARFDTYIAGDSRSVILSESDFPAVHGRKFYNIASAGDDIASIVKRLEFLIGRGCPIAAVVVGGSLDATLRSSANGLSRRECPAISGENRAIFYARYFLSSQALMDYVSILVSGTSHPLRYYADGHADYMWSMKSDFAEACAPQTTPAKNTLLAELSGYGEFAVLAARNHFKAIVWIAPGPTQRSSPRDTYMEQYIAQLRAIPNLSIIEPDLESPLLADIHYWHDCVHFRRTVFQQLASPAASALLVEP
jgi:hypothetical protein